MTGSISHLVSFRITPDIKRLSTSAELASGESVSTSTDGSLVFRIKYAFGQVNFDQWTTRDTWIRIGPQQTPIIDYLEGIYRYRFQGTVFANRETSPGGQPYLDSSDFGLSGHYSLPSNYGDIHAGYYNGKLKGVTQPLRSVSTPRRPNDLRQPGACCSIRVSGLFQEIPGRHWDTAAGRTPRLSLSDSNVTGGVHTRCSANPGVGRKSRPFTSIVSPPPPVSQP